MFQCIYALFWGLTVIGYSVFAISLKSRGITIGIAVVAKSFILLVSLSLCIHVLSRASHCMPFCAGILCYLLRTVCCSDDIGNIHT